MTRQQDDGDTKDWSDLMLQAAENVANARWTMLPVRVVTYDPVRQCVDVKPVVPITDGDGVPRPIPPLFCFPVVYPAWGLYRTQAPILPGDVGMLFFSSASISQWLTTGTDDAPPESPRRGSLSDGFYLGGIHSFAGPSPPPAASTGLRIGATAAWIEITDPTVVLVEAPSIQLGATAVENLTKWQTLKTDLDLIKKQFDDLVISLATGSNGGGPVVFGTPYVNTYVVGDASTTKVTGE